MKNCPVCQKSFQPKDQRRDSVHCSRQCAGQSRRSQVLVSCKVCSKEFHRKAYHAAMTQERGPFCSFDCYAQWQSENLKGPNNPQWKGPLEKECPGCGSLFHVRRADQSKVFCTRSCWLRFVQTDYPSSTTLYNTLWLRQRDLALERDGCQCVECGSKRSLVVHHRKRLREFLAEAVRLAHELDNLETVCEACHGHRHSPRLQNPAKIR